MMEARTLAQFAGYTSRVSELFDVLEDVNKGKYERTMVADNSKSAPGASSLIKKPTIVDTALLPGTVVEADNVIQFDRVPIVTPNGDVLIRELSFEVTHAHFFFVGTVLIVSCRSSRA